ARERPLRSTDENGSGDDVLRVSERRRDGEQQRERNRSSYDHDDELRLSGRWNVAATAADRACGKAAMRTALWHSCAVCRSIQLRYTAAHYRERQGASMNRLMRPLLLPLIVGGCASVRTSGPRPANSAPA